VDGPAPLMSLNGARDQLGQLHVETAFSSCQLSYFPDARWQKSSERLHLIVAKRWTLEAVLIADVVNAGQRHIALHIA